MRGSFRAGLITLLVLIVGGLPIVTPAVSAGQARGGGSVISSPPASGSSRSSGPNRPAIPSGSALPVPPRQPIQWRLAVQRQPFPGGRNPYFVFWFGYLSVYPAWADDLVLSGPLDSTAPPLPLPADGVPTGGLQLDVEPRRSQVYVDGFYAGPVDDFRGYYHHLDLQAGPHRVDLLLSGYPAQAIDVVVTPGRTTTYRGTLGAVMRVD